MVLQRFQHTPNLLELRKCLLYDHFVKEHVWRSIISSGSSVKQCKNAVKNFVLQSRAIKFVLFHVQNGSRCKMELWQS
ncbi:unnamed protein product [Sphenostylis stenocarpa]|uniref:Uncharacterized protein n=1 Tax=Sphenostylis stenocarpa TaxID=92480 RepID=A0AA86S4L9_9FABA|nr:unnamed protein product [Sphenostylis stenocarpa]